MKTNFKTSIKCQNIQHQVCLDVRGAGFGQPIGVSGCHHQLGNQVINFFSLHDSVKMQNIEFV